MRKIWVILAAAFMLSSVAMAQVTPIADIQTVTDPATEQASPMVGQTVTVEGWVTFEPKSKRGNGFFMADAAGAWNAIFVYGGETDLEFHYGFGWKVSVTGVIAEYNDLTQLKPVAAEDVEVLESTVDWSNLPAACAYTTVSAGDIGNEATATAEQWESVLVQVEDVTTSNVDAGYSEWEVQDATSNIVRIDDPQDNVYGYVHHVKADQPYERIRGILNQHYGYKILPEIAFDLKVDEDTANGFYTQFAYFQQVRPMDMTIQHDDEDNPFTYDWSYCFHRRNDETATTGDTVSVHGLVTMATGISYAGAGIKFIMTDFDTDVAGEPWSAVLSYDPDSTSFPHLFKGDEVEVRGYITEYYTGNTSKMTELFITEAINVISTDNTLPAEPGVTVPELRDPITAEQWGTVFIKVYDSIVTNNELQRELFTIDNDPDDDIPGVMVDNDAEDAFEEYVLPPVTAVIDSVSGWLYNHFGSLEDEDGTSWCYKLEPLDPSDIAVGDRPPSIVGVTRDQAMPVAAQDVVVSATITDNSDVTAASMFYRLDSEETFTEVAMTEGEASSWSATLPGQADGSLVWFYIKATDDADVSSTAPNNIEEELYGYFVGEDLNIHDATWTPYASGNSLYNGYVVTLTGVVSNTAGNAAIYADDTYGKTYFMQTNGDDAAFSGIVFHAGDDLEVTLAQGDNVTVTGTVNEEGAGWDFKWGGNTRMIDVTSATINSSDNAVTAYATDIQAINAAKESFESVAISLTNVVVSSANQYDWTITDDSGETFLIDDDFASREDTDPLHQFFTSLSSGIGVSELSGLVTYSYNSWKIELRDMEDVGEVAVGEGVAVQPLSFELKPVYPNPFNPSTSINFTVPTNSEVKLIVYNVMGQKVRTLINAPVVAGQHAAYWNGRNDAGASVTSGTYFLRLAAGSNIQTQKMILVK